MTDVFRKGGFTADDRPRLGDDEPIGDGAFFVSRARFLADRETLIAHGAKLGLVLEPADRLDDLVGDLASIGAIAVHFPKFGDGRGYSLARLLRDRHGFSGELRAFGDILWDQLEALSRVGFDTLEVTDEPTRRRLAEGRLPESAVRYQPDARDHRPIAGRPWASFAYKDVWCGG